LISFSRNIFDKALNYVAKLSLLALNFITQIVPFKDPFSSQNYMILMIMIAYEFDTLLQ